MKTAKQPKQSKDTLQLKDLKPKTNPKAGQMKTTRSNVVGVWVTTG